MARHGGKVLVDQLSVQEVDQVFLVPGESYLAVLDGLADADHINTVTCRQEGGAAMMAEAYGKLTGKPGICMVTRGPGATNAAAGVHIAHQDSTPMILFIGQIGRDMVDREAFQEVDYRQMFGPLCKWVAQIDSVDRIPEYISQAFHKAMNGRPGPVVLALPEDMLTETTDVEDCRPAQRIPAYPAQAQIDTVTDALAQARSPLVIVGGGNWTDDAGKALTRVAEKAGLPIANSFRCQSYFDNNHHHYAGDVGIAPDPVLAKAVKDSDLLIVIGARIGEMTSSGYSLLNIPNPKQKLIHVYPDAAELGRVYRPDIGIVSDAGPFLAMLAESGALIPGPWQDWRLHLNTAYKRWVEPVDVPGDAKMPAIVHQLGELADDNAVFTNGAGNYAAFLHRFHNYGANQGQLAPTSGSMGYGLPAAVAAKLTAPERQVICFAGDGCYMMHGQELATAVQHGANIITVLVNNSMYGTIRMHQERNYPARVSGTALQNPDFVALAKAYGAFGIKVTRTEDFAAAFAEAIAANKPALIEIITDPEAINPRTTLSAIRAAAEQAG